MSDDATALGRGPHDYGHSFGNKPLLVIRHGQKFPGPAAVLEDGQKHPAAMSTRGELIVAEKSNHMIQLDQPDVVISAIRHVVGMVKEEKKGQGRCPWTPLGTSPQTPLL